METGLDPDMLKKFAPLFALGFALGAMLVMASAPARAASGIISGR
jgi:hypothetical protein